MDSWQPGHIQSPLNSLTPSAGVDERRMLERHMDVIMGLAYPLPRTGDDQDRLLAISVLEDGLVAQHFGGE